MFKLKVRCHYTLTKQRHHTKKLGEPQQWRQIRLGRQQRHRPHDQLRHNQCFAVSAVGAHSDQTSDELLYV